MGNASSKVAAKAASKLSATNTARKYPTRSPPTSSPTTNARPRPSADAAAGPQVHPETKATSSRDQAINRDASDPDLALNARLQQLGPVQPNPTLSNSSAFNPPISTTSHFQPSSSAPSQSIFPNPASNPAVSLLTARYRLAEEAEKEFEGIGRRGAAGRTFLDVLTLRQVLVMRDKGVSQAEIERILELKSGVVGRLGGKDVVSATGSE
ncbi:hypothetical protein LSUE1_G000097 [Lachnellula suecica]|uniref:Helix-turn-helix domain-containing protein n=1 Tax=Lachnellula suecica TaxID=602035 RepID=A0A8T9CJH2_9HELO|nr:hypothetical protein LSUE1_G000097 [Lachnellula suecica]